jgi:hypothetical protein
MPRRNDFQENSTSLRPVNLIFNVECENIRNGISHACTPSNTPPTF